jgi:hypothetical protein
MSAYVCLRVVSAGNRESTGGCEGGLPSGTRTPTVGIRLREVILMLALTPRLARCSMQESQSHSLAVNPASCLA